MRLIQIVFVTIYLYVCWFLFVQGKVIQFVKIILTYFLEIDIAIVDIYKSSHVSKHK